MSIDNNVVLHLKRSKYVVFADKDLQNSIPISIDKLSSNEKNLIINIMFREKFLKKNEIEKTIHYKRIKTINDFNGFFEDNNLNVKIVKKKNFLEIITRDSENKKYKINYSKYRLLKQNQKTLIHTLNFNKEEMKIYNEMNKKDFEFIESNQQNENKYEKYIEIKEIEKKYNGKNGFRKKRTIYILTNQNMVNLLKKVNMYLTSVFIKLNKNSYNYAYQKKRSYKNYLEVHTGAKEALHLDIQNFFDSINDKMIRNEMEEAGFDETIINFIIKSCTIRKQGVRILMQGNPLAPMISNYVFSSIDKKIYKICKDNAVNYSRYCDDLLLSSENKKVEEIKVHINKILNESGFELNQSKERYMEKEILISKIRIKEDGLYIKSSYTKNLNNVLLILEKYYTNNKIKTSGIIRKKEIKSIEKNLKNEMLTNKIEIFMKQLKGKIEYANSINNLQYPVIKTIIKYNNLCKIIEEVDEIYIPRIKKNIPVFSNMILIYTEKLEKKYFIIYKKGRNFRLDLKEEDSIYKVFIIENGALKEVDIYPQGEYSINKKIYIKYRRKENYIEFQNYENLIIQKTKNKLDERVNEENIYKVEKQLEYVKRNING